MITSQVTRQGFVDFCKAQGDKAIDHSGKPLHGKAQTDSSVFDRCAVGSYYRHLHGKRITRDNSVEFNYELSQAIGSDVADKLGNYEPSHYSNIVELLA